MRTVIRCLAGSALAFSLCACASTRAKASSAGELVIVGGGGTTPPILARALELARGAETSVVVLPQASQAEKRGEDSAQMWRDAGAREARVVEFDDRDAARAAISAADMIWIAGGDQSRFMAAARDAGLIELLRERHRAGCVVGGTSAGAAVMSPWMITGEPEDAPTKLAPGSVALVEGLGLFEGAIVDQHFVVRQRNNRLVSAVLEHPELVGYGVNERTALIVRGDVAEVVGEGPVVVIDARSASIAPRESAPTWNAVGLSLKVLANGASVRLP